MDSVLSDNSGEGHTSFGSDLLDKMMKACQQADPVGAVTMLVPSHKFPSTFVPDAVPGFIGLISPVAPKGEDDDA